MSKKGSRNVGRYYRQQVLSGYEHFIQQEKQDNDSASVEQRGTQAAIWNAREQACYQILVPVIIEKISVDSERYGYKILLNDDVDILVAPYSKRGKKTTKPPTSIPGKTGQKSSSLRMVYGVHATGQPPLSHPLELNVPEALARLYSFILGKIDATLQCTLQQLENPPGDDDTRERAESASPPKSVGANKEGRRSKKVRAKILPEALSEIPAQVDELDGALLGSGQGDNDNRLDSVGNDSFVGTALEGFTLDY
jgi:hypothetical protein